MNLNAEEKVHREGGFTQKHKKTGEKNKRVGKRVRKNQQTKNERAEKGAIENRICPEGNSKTKKRLCLKANK